MTEARPAAARRPTEAAASLDRLRQRNVDYLRPQPDAQRRIDTALHAYVALEQQIEQIHTAARNDINQIRQQQAIAVWQMSQTGRTVQQIAELLDIPQADTWQLLSAGRIAAAYATDDQPSHHTNPPDQQQPRPRHPTPPDRPSEQQQIPSWVAAHQHGMNPRVVPATSATVHINRHAAPDGTTQTRA